MNSEMYHAFTAALQARLLADERVLGLVALGSMAEQDYLPDQWSDHDFFVIVQPGTQEVFRADVRWLPSFDRIVFQFRETVHGMKVVYNDGHLLEFAIFDVEEIYLAGVNRYRILIDRAEIAGHMRAIAGQTQQRAAVDLADATQHIGQFVTNILVGVGRYYRGERLSAHQFVKHSAVTHLLTLFASYIPAPQHDLLDSLNPSRRFERVYPALSHELNSILSRETPDAAQQLLELAQRELAAHLPGDLSQIIPVIAATIRRDR